jgi:CRP/FNR family nitrogen fixation transcriptional regulator
VASLAKVDTFAAKQLLDITNEELQRAKNHSLLLRQSANERVANFLFEMKKRNRQRVVEILMTRRDIANYLNLTPESVSRALAQLKRKSAISFSSHRHVDVRLRKPIMP